MRCNSPQILTSVLDHATSLSQIHERTVALTKLANIVKMLLPTPLQDQCRVANYRQGVLILEVSSANWLSRVKYEHAELLLGIRQKLLPALSSIQYKVNPDMKNTSSSDKLQTDKFLSRNLTHESACYLYALAEYAPENLKKQLIKLANHAK